MIERARLKTDSVSNTPDTGCPEILLFEDNPGDAWQTTAVIYDHWGDRVRLSHVSRIPDGLRLMERQEFDVILLDLVLPMYQGVETFRAVSSHAGSTPIIVFSGLPLRREVSSEIRQRAHGFFLKGETRSRTLLQSISDAFSRRAAFRQVLQEPEGVRPLSSDSVHETIFGSQAAPAVTRPGSR